jgi:hypothetical protein
MDEMAQDFRTKIGYMETLLIEKEDELRVEEEKKYYAEEVQI